MAAAAVITAVTWAFFTDFMEGYSSFSLKESSDILPDACFYGAMPGSQ
jgi:hypothetical protein